MGEPSGEITGLCLILGSYSIHLLECEAPMMNKIMYSLNDLQQQPGSLYSQIWIIHQTEEVTEFFQFDHYSVQSKSIRHGCAKT